MKILYLITARGGSKGVKRKNIREIGGLPLVAFKIIAAQKCKYDGRIIVSTDDQEIADVCAKYGAEVPFMRPDYLSSDTATSLDVVEHAVQWIEANDTEKYDYIFLLEPASPFGTSEDFEKAIELMMSTDADSVLGVKEAEKNSKFIKTLDENGRMSNFYREVVKLSNINRQAQEKEYVVNGCLYVIKWDYFKKNKMIWAENSVPYIMPDVYSVDINNEIDLGYANYLVESGNVDMGYWNK